MQHYARQVLCSLTAVLVCLGVCGMTGISYAQANDGEALNMELFERLLDELRDKYVEQVDEEELVRWGIEGILQHLDPYTDFYERSRIEQLRSVTTGEYGGIGLYIDEQDGNIVVLSPIENSPAAEAGLLPGDIIRSVYGRLLSEVPLDRVIAQIKGDIGTTVNLSVEREGEPELLHFSLIRRIIDIKDIPYYSMIQPATGYIRLSHFSQKAPTVLAAAVHDLEIRGMESLILDLRGNPGGLLTAAIDIADIFVDPGQTIVSTRGRNDRYQVVYRAQRAPLMADMPLVVLVDGVSASASEIVSGAIQDLNRGLILGSRTFGKGLVQSIVYTDGGAALKLTTMRYYTPNGRSIDGTDELIQRQVDWDVYQTDEPQVQDSTAQANKGIEPDIIVETPDQTPIVRELVRRGVFSRFAIDYLQQANPEDSLNVGEEVVQAFQQYLESLRYEPGSQLIESVNSLEQMAEGQNLDAGFYNHLTELRNHVREYNQVALDTEDPWLVYFLTEALHWIADGEAGRIAATLPMDPVVQQSLSILEDAEAYSSYLEETDYTAVSSTP